MENQVFLIYNKFEGWIFFSHGFKHAFSFKTVRVDNEKIESLRLNYFGLSRSLTIEMKCRISAGSVLTTLLVPEMASFIEISFCQKWAG